MGMTTKNLASVLMSIGAIDDLADIIENQKGVNYPTLPERIRRCTQKIIECLDIEHTYVIKNAGVSVETSYGLSKKLLNKNV